jgi:hypothetical protein
MPDKEQNKQQERPYISANHNETLVRRAIAANDNETLVRDGLQSQL